MKITSAAFVDSGAIPLRYTGEGEDISPDLIWTDVPANCVELVLICHDPDAPRPEGWVHWVVCKIPPSTSEIAERDDRSFVQGKNDFGRLGYGGPMPPQGHGVHHYHFSLFALDQESGAEPGITREELLAKIEGHVVSQANLVGTYERK